MPVWPGPSNSNTLYPRSRPARPPIKYISSPHPSNPVFKMMVLRGVGWLSSGSQTPARMVRLIGVTEIFGGTVIHRGAQQMVACADAMSLGQRLAAEFFGLLSKLRVHLHPTFGGSARFFVAI